MTDLPHAPRQLLIVGGGTAGWLTAAFLARTLGTGAGGPAITVVDAPQIGAIGVGEGSFPSLRGTLSLLGLDEAGFIRDTSATFKQGIRFDHWVQAPGGPGPSGYFHPFSHPSQMPGGPELLPLWLRGDAGPGTAFADAVTLQQRVVQAQRAPKRAADADWQGPLNYAYHFDALKLASLLARHAQGLGVRHVAAEVTDVPLREDGSIAGVLTDTAGRLEADLYIDCTGLRARLIGQALGAPLHTVGDQLFVDRALALQLPWGSPDQEIPPCTLATATPHGWIWDIGLQTRRGLGHVYSSRHCDDATAEQLLRAHAGPAARDLPVRPLQLPTGWRPTPWVKNCVAVGLAGGFLEPLEASGIGLVETAAYLIGFLFPHGGELGAAARQFNALMDGRYQRITDFLKLHYALSQRTDSAFWRDNRDPATWSPTLRDRLAQWRTRPPHRLDFVTDLEMYPPSSWQYVLYGMVHAPALPAGLVPAMPPAQGAATFTRLHQVAAHACGDLPPHRALLAQLAARAGAPSAQAAQAAASARPSPLESTRA